MSFCYITFQHVFADFFHNLQNNRTIAADHELWPALCKGTNSLTWAWNKGEGTGIKKSPISSYVLCNVHHTEGNHSVCPWQRLNNALASCGNLTGHFEYSHANTAKLEIQQTSHGQEEKSLVRNFTLKIIKWVQQNKEGNGRQCWHNKKPNLAMLTSAEYDRMATLGKLLHAAKVCHWAPGWWNAFGYFADVMEVSDVDRSLHIVCTIRGP